MNSSRLRYHPDSRLILYEPRAGHGVDEEARLDPLELLARVLIHIPEPHKHLVHFYGAYANRVRSSYRKENTGASDETETTPSRRAVNKRWAELIYRIYVVDPLTCPRCDSPMKLLAFITEPDVIRKIIRAPRSHLIPSKAPDAGDARPSRRQSTGARTTSALRQ